MITFTDIWQGSTGLLARFGLKPTSKKAHLKFCEECAEFQESLFELSDNRTSDLLRNDAADEWADVLVTLCNMAYSAGLTESELEKAMKRTLDKNNAKSETTHEVRDGMICKRKPVAEAAS